MSSATCRASSRVGTRTSALGRLSAVVVRSTIGIAKASVLPEPVGDFASTSRPASASGRTRDWMVNGSWMERAASASATGADTPKSRKQSSRKDCWDKSFLLLLVSRLAYLEHPKEEREAHLTGRQYCRPCKHGSTSHRMRWARALARP